MTLKFLGQSSFLVQVGGKNIIFDPFISANPKASSIDVNALKANYILLTHGHQDHSLDTETIAKNNDAVVVSNYEIAAHYGNMDIKWHPMNTGGKWNFNFGTVKSVAAVHSSSFPDGKYAGNPGGFVVWNDEVCFYHAGDTALTLDMKLIPMLCPKLDFAILPIGDNFTMGYEDAIIASEFIACDKIIGCHFDTFGFIEIDHKAAVEAFKAKGKELILLDVGEEISL